MMNLNMTTEVPSRLLLPKTFIELFRVWTRDPWVSRRVYYPKSIETDVSIYMKYYFNIRHELNWMRWKVFYINLFLFVCRYVISLMDYLSSVSISYGEFNPWYIYFLKYSIYFVLLINVCTVVICIMEQTLITYHSCTVHWIAHVFVTFLLFTDTYHSVRTVIKK